MPRIARVCAEGYPTPHNAEGAITRRQYFLIMKTGENSYERICGTI